MAKPKTALDEREVELAAIKPARDEGTPPEDDRIVATSPPLPTAPPPEVPKRSEVRGVKRATFRVWVHGTLQRNGTTYQPGDTLVLAEDEAAKIVCLERVD